MRLLNTKTLELQEFIGAAIPIYAIISHTWEEEEVSFTLFQDEEKRQCLKGWQKLNKCCRYTGEFGFEWLWIDTCCINKDSSAELTEAINSMYSWYMNAACCYAYLCDVDASQSSGDSDSVLRQFDKSRWWTRGWTLQELLASGSVLFLDRHCSPIGFKHAPELLKRIHDITGIHTRAIRERDDIQGFSVAAKMSWAATRRCTREEDEAYSLMGLFGVNMPLLYGEGQKAFDRLQNEILKISDDETIFAWDPNDRSEKVCALSPDTNGLLARSPKDFQKSGDIEPETTEPFLERPPYQLTNKGLQIHLGLQAVPHGQYPRHWTVHRSILNCVRKNHPRTPMVILIATERRMGRDGSFRTTRSFRIGTLEKSDRWPELSEEPTKQQIVFLVRRSRKYEIETS